MIFNFAKRSKSTKSEGSRKRSQKWSLAPLEQRLLLAGDAGAAVSSGAVSGNAVAEVPSEVGADIRQETDRQQTSRSVVFIDSAIQDFDELSDAALANSEIVLLQADRSGIDQISQYLSSRRGIEAIHLVGHGDDGQIVLGNETIDTKLLHQRGTAVRGWANAITDNADILIYGCETGRGDSGETFVRTLASLTGADVAASTDLTGDSRFGGDWDLERVVGSIEASLAFDLQSQRKYQHVMPITIRAAGSTNDETLELRIDGETVQYFSNIGGDADAGIFETYTYDGPSVSADRVQVAFSFAAYSPPGYDQNLRVDSISIDGVTYETEDPSVFSTGTWKPEDGITPGFRQDEFLHDNGYFQYAGSSSNGSNIVVTANGTEGPESFQLQIDETTVATFNSIGTNQQDFSYQASENVSIDRIRVVFFNDVYDPVNGVDRNLIVDKVTIDGVEHQTEAPTVFSTGSWRPEDGVVPGFRETESLNVNGYFAYGGSTNDGSTIVVSARGNDGPENFDLQIDGVTVASFDSIGTNQQDFTYQAAGNVTADQVRVAFTNDVFNPAAGVDHNLIVDRISIDGEVFETEDASVFSTGTWLPSDGVAPGFRLSETLHVDGYFQYASRVTPTRPAIRINAGGGDYLDVNGNLWQADAYFDGGNVYSTVDDIAQTNDDLLYQTERWNESLAYDIPIENGAYSVNLHFAEIFFEDFGQRSFDVAVEGQLVEDDLDIFERARNAFFAGDDNALVINVPQVLVSDGNLDLDLVASVNNAKISAIEIVPVDGPGVLLVQNGGSTTVNEGGSGDSYQIRLNSAPTSNVTVSLGTNSSQINAGPSSLTFTPGNWQTPQTVTVSAVDDNSQEGTQAYDIVHSISSADSQYSNISVPNLTVVVTDNDVVPIQFNQTTVASVADPTTAAWGPDGRLYVGSTTGVITALTFNDNNQVIDTQQINTLAGLSNNNILGIAFNPFDDPNSPQLYVAHGQLFANGGASFPEDVLSPYSGQVTALTGNNFQTATPLITALPVSNHDHGINGIAFDGNGDLYVAVGGNTNAGIENSAIGGIPESPFSGAVLKAEITKANFNGAIDYVLNPDFTPPGGLSFDAEDSQTFGDQVSVISGLDVSVFASGLRNPYDIVFTRDGLLYGTDNGPNDGFGAVSTGPNSQSPAVGAPDELLLLSEGDYFGHPNRTRGVDNPIENIYFGPDQPSSGDYVAPLASVPSSTNGIDEYRSEVFGGQLNGQLLIQQYNGPASFVQLSADGQSVIATSTINGIADGLDVLMGPGGSIFGIDFAQDRITVATPVDPTVNVATAYDISTWRAPATGGAEFTIGGVNFGDLSNTSVTIGGQAVQILSVSENRIRAILPAFTDPGNALLDVVVTSNGNTSILEDAYLPLV